MSFLARFLKRGGFPERETPKPPGQREPHEAPEPRESREPDPSLDVFFPAGTDKTDKTPRMNGVSSFLSVPSGKIIPKLSPPQAAPEATPEGPPPRHIVLAIVAEWSIPWRQRWSDRANELQFTEGHSQDQAERAAFAVLLPRRAAWGLAAKGRPDEPGPDS
jgi:hypothetical protein